MIKYSDNVLLKEIKHDFVIGTLYSYKKYILVLLIFVFISLTFKGHVELLHSKNGVSVIPSLGDYIVYTFKGMDIFQGFRDSSFKIPGEWILINIYLSYVIGYYPLNDLKNYGQQILLRSKKRGQWWLSKCIWILGNILIFYAIGYIVMGFFTLIGGGTLSLNTNEEISTIISKINTNNLGSTELLLMGVLLPIAISVGLSLLQVTIALFTSSLLGNIITISILVISAYYCNSFLLGNYLMISRSSLIISDAGVNLITGFIMSFLLSIIAIIVGKFGFEKVDILDKSKN